MQRNIQTIHFLITLVLLEEHAITNSITGLPVIMPQFPVCLGNLGGSK